MHGLVVVDKNQKFCALPLFGAIAVLLKLATKLLKKLGEENCLTNLLNSPGNFTASKLKWVKDNEPELYSKDIKLCCLAII